MNPYAFLRSLLLLKLIQGNSWQYFLTDLQLDFLISRITYKDNREHLKIEPNLRQNRAKFEILHRPTITRQCTRMYPI